MPERGNWVTTMDTPGALPADFPTDGVKLSHVLVVGDYARSLAFYSDVLGARLVHELPELLAVLNFQGSQILLSAPRSPTRTGDTPADRACVISELTIRVPGCLAAYEALRARGVAFITPPFLWGEEVRAFFHDPDGHLLEIVARWEPHSISAVASG